MMSKNFSRTEAGFTMVELLVIISVIGIISVVIYPSLMCSYEKARLASATEDLRVARDKIELYEIELGNFPATLQEAFGDQEPPKTLVYCFDGEDRNNGHGNEWCTFFDNSNPSGNNSHGGVPGGSYVLRTIDSLATRCSDVDYVWTACCGRDPNDVPVGGTGPNGHPGNKS